MFEALSVFSPLNIFQNLYHKIIRDLDLGPSSNPPKSMNQAFGDKDFWEAHYSTIIVEELTALLSQGPLTQKTLMQIKERLTDCQEIVGRYTLSPEYYEDGIDDLVRTFPKGSQEDGHLGCIAMLENVRLDFRVALKEDQDFTRECFIGDVNHLIGQYRENKIRASHFEEAINYYADVMTAAHYYDALVNLDRHLHAIPKASPLLEKVQKLLAACDLAIVKQSRQLLMHQRKKAQAQEVANHTVESLNIKEVAASISKSFLDRSFEAVSSALYFIRTHPLESIAMGLVAQSTASAALTISASPTPSSSAIVEFRINTYTSGDQTTPCMASLAEGGFVVAWQSNGQDGVGWGIYGQTYDGTGNTLGSEFLISTDTALGNQESPSVAGLANGGAIVTWMGPDQSGWGIYGQQYDINMAALGTPFQINTYTQNDQQYPSVAALTDGSFVVAWQSYNENGNNGFGIYGQHYNPSGVAIGGEFQIVQGNYRNDGDQTNPYVAALTGGGWVVTWYNGATNAPLLRYDASGLPIGSIFVVSDLDGRGYGVVALSNGGFLATEASYNGGNNPTRNVFGQQFDVSGATLGGIIQLSTNVFIGSIGGSSVQVPYSVSGLANGGFVATWQNYSLTTSSWDICSQSFDGTGNVVGSAFQINTYIQNDQTNPSVAVLVGGGFGVVWQSNGEDGSGWGIYGRLYLPPPSASASPSRPPSLTTSISNSGTSSLSALGTSSSSASGTPSFSGSRTPSLSSLPTTATPTLTGSSSITPSFSGSNSVTPSFSPSSGMTPSFSGSNSVTPSSSLSGVTLSPSGAITITSSLTPNALVASNGKSSSSPISIGVFAGIGIAGGLGLVGVISATTCYFKKRSVRAQIQPVLRKDTRADSTIKGGGIVGASSSTDWKPSAPELLSNASSARVIMPAVPVDLDQDDTPVVRASKIAPLVGHEDILIRYEDLVFELEKGEKIELGEGSFGIVYKGTWHGAPVAIKQIKELHVSKQVLEDFEREIKILVRLRHPNIIEFYGYCMTPQKCLVMHYMSNGSLYKVLHERTIDLSWRQKMQIASQMAYGLAFLHDKKILHQDIKSLNVLIDESLCARLTDFGLSKIKSESRSLSRTQSSSVAPIVGTLVWMAPELFRPNAKFTEKADMYSYGMTLWEMTSHEIPFAQAVSPSLIPTWVVQGEREPIVEECPPKLASLIESCWAGNPEERPAANEVVAFFDAPQEDFKGFLSAYRMHQNKSKIGPGDYTTSEKRGFRAAP